MSTCLRVKYLDEIGGCPVLSREEETALARRYRDAHEVPARDRLITCNLRLVAKLARGYAKSGDRYLDLVQEGNLALLEAVERFDPERGVRFPSYAAFWIRAFFLRYLMRDARLIRIGTSQPQRRLFFRLRHAAAALEAGAGPVTDAVLAEHLHTRERDVREMRSRLGISELSLDAPSSREAGRPVTRGEHLAAPSAARPDRQVERHEAQARTGAKVLEFAAGLSGREQKIFQGRWLSEPQRTLKDLGDELGVSRERSRQLERRLLDRLRLSLGDDLGKAALEALAS